MTNGRDISRHIAVIADDLTGANDTGVQFAKQGLKTIVLMGVDSSPGRIEEDVVVVDSQSRALPPEDAYRKVAKAALLFKDRRFHAVFKKIDSTLRGNIGREIDAIMDTCGQELALVAPAFPKNGRITVGGYHFLQGAPLEATEIARDPKCPITESHLPTLLSGQTVRKVGHVGIKSVLAGPDGILSAMGKLADAGERVIVCDVWRDEHLKMHAMAAMRLRKPILWVGSAGLAEYLPLALGWVAAPAEREPVKDAPVGERTVVVLSGSVSNVTRGQVRMLERRPGVEHIEVDSCALLQPETAPGEIRRCFDAAMKAARAGKDTIISSGTSDEIVDGTMDKAMSMGLSSQRTAEVIATALGSLCRQIAMNVKLKGLVLTGGDIAISSCSLLSATGFNVVEEVEPGIPVGVLKGGLCDGLRVVTKAGAFGTEDALCKAVDCLKRDRREGIAR